MPREQCRPLATLELRNFEKDGTMTTEEAVKTITDIVAENARLKEKLAAAEADLAKLREVVGEAEAGTVQPAPEAEG